MEKKFMKRKGNKVGSCPFLPMTRQNTDLGMGKCVKHLSEKCEKHIFVLTSFCSISKSLVYYHQISLAYAMPKHTSCHKRICSRLGSKTIFLRKRAEIWIWGWKKCIYEKWGAIPFFTDLPEFRFVDGKFLRG